MMEKTINKNPKISIIVPVYNVQDYLKKCLESILSQTFKDYELILINDGSVDQSLNICKLYRDRDPRVKVISQKNMGLSAARNTGIMHARGEYICFIDSDDFIEEKYIQLLFEQMLRSDSDIVMCEFFLTKATGEKISQVKFNEPNNIVELTGKQVLNYIVSPQYIANVVAWNKLYKSSVFSKLEYSVGRFYEDEFIAFPLFFNAKKIEIIRVPLYNYVQRENSIMHNPMTDKKIMDRIDMYQARIDFCKQKKLKIYEDVINQYKDWMITIGLNNTKNKNIKHKLQSDFRKYSTFKNERGIKRILKDSLGYCNLNLAYKIYLLKNDVLTK